ncbi:hypothetical protein [[Flexibacter] sp. ATCC 35103]|uniref:hypothetical protein n=1 Tax=[Flexibacter] sp. ATCC 35103 TaxID=1937528 RepID=UPI0009CA73D0|nr:hypothetical protein [[Flexibacter] sp. ATCC 35103]OMQ13399.1 hypothetical protein BXU01_02660 [[Flexibacter] sp. ATCC 35103]
MNNLFKNIINFSSGLTAQLKVAEKFSNTIKIQSQFSKTSVECKKYNSISSKIEESNNLFSKWQNLATVIDFNINEKSLKLSPSVNSSGMSNSWNELQEFVRSQKYFEKINSSFYLPLTPKYKELGVSKSWDVDHFVPKSRKSEFDNFKFYKSFKNLEHYETLQSFAEYDVAKSRILKDEISNEVERIINGSVCYNDIYDSIYRSTREVVDRDYSQRKQSLENLKNYIINGDFDFKYTIGLEDLLWTHFTRIEELEETINRTVFELKILNKIIISISNCFKKCALNKRDFFRKINSFHFKNLDDEYHSFSLAA